MANYPLSALSQHRQARRVRPRGRTWALPLASVLLLHAPLVGAGEGGWRVCGVPGRMEAARGTAGGFLREGGWERGLAGGAGQRGELLRLRGGRKKGEVEGESGSAPAESDDDPMKNDPPPDRMRYTGGVHPSSKLVKKDKAPIGQKDAIFNFTEAQPEKDKVAEDSGSTDQYWIDGTIRQGLCKDGDGVKLNYTDGHPDFWGFKNWTDPNAKYYADSSKGHTPADFHLVKRKGNAVDLTRQLQFREDTGYRGLNTTKWKWAELHDRHKEDYPEPVGEQKEMRSYKWDYDKKMYKYSYSMWYPANSSMNNATRLLEPWETQAKFIPPEDGAPVPYEKSAARIIQDLQDEERWMDGELPLEMNAEDQAELDHQEKVSIDDQLCLAAEAGSLGMFRDLLDAGADVTHHLYPDMLTSLHYAALNGHLDIAKICLEKGADINATDDWNRTAYHWAAYNGHVPVARFLVQKGVHVMFRTHGGWTGYQFAGTFQYFHPEVVDFFRDQQARFDRKLEGGSSIFGEKALQEQDDKNEDKKKKEEKRKEEQAQQDQGRDTGVDPVKDKQEKQAARRKHELRNSVS